MRISTACVGFPSFPNMLEKTPRSLMGGIRVRMCVRIVIVLFPWLPCDSCFTFLLG